MVTCPTTVPGIPLSSKDMVIVSSFRLERKTDTESTFT
jgi:hypothetical protein